MRRFLLIRSARARRSTASSNVLGMCTVVATNIWLNIHLGVAAANVIAAGIASASVSLTWATVFENGDYGTTVTGGGAGGGAGIPPSSSADQPRRTKPPSTRPSSPTSRRASQAAGGRGRLVHVSPASPETR
jgi:hypothetical protein